MKKLYTFLILSYTFLLSSQTTITFTTNSLNGEDAYLASGTPSTNFGTHITFGGSIWTCTGNPCNARGLMRFDISSIPTNAIISNASLNLFADLNWGAAPTTGGTANDGMLLKVLAAWTESTVTWASQPATTTLNMVTIAGSTSTAQNYTFNLTGMTQDWVTTPVNNFGFLIKLNDEINYYKSLMFASSDNTVTANRPKLTVTYSLPSTGLNALTFQNERLVIFPNPTTNNFTIKNIENGNKYVIRDITNREISSGQTIDNLNISLSDQSNGIYFISIYTKNGIITRKIVKSQY